MTATTTSIRPRKAPRGPLIWIVPVLFAVFASLFVLNLASSEPARASLTVQNPTGAYVTVSAKGESGGWLGLGTVDPHSGDRFESIADQGAVWDFRFTVGPDRVGELVRTKSQLEQSNWRITIPKDAADELRSQRHSP
jgi:hypothetical protein